jgi:hypothetical protein
MNPNQPDVVMIGTTHHVQEGRCDVSQRDEFETLITEVCGTYRFNAIVEETNPEALSMAGVERTMCSRVAAELSLPWLFCEPNSDERAALGILG